MILIKDHLSKFGMCSVQHKSRIHYMRFSEAHTSLVIYSVNDLNLRAMGYVDFIQIQYVIPIHYEAKIRIIRL